MDNSIKIIMHTRPQFFFSAAAAATVTAASKMK